MKLTWFDWVSDYTVCAVSCWFIIKNRYISSVIRINTASLFSIPLAIGKKNNNSGFKIHIWGMSVSFILCSVFCCGSPSRERVNNSHVWEIPEVLVSIIHEHQYHFTSPCFETHRQRLIVTGSFRNALCCICHSPECFPILIPHSSTFKPGTETSGPGVTGRGCAEGCVTMGIFYRWSFSREVYLWPRIIMPYGGI